VLSRVVRIFETFGPDTPALRVTDIARRAGLHVATASRMVDELVGHGWLRRDPDRRIRVGVRLWELASRASPTLGLREAAMPFMEDLHAVVGHHTQLAVLLAYASAELQEQVLAGPLDAFRRTTLTDPERLRRFLADVRRDGYAFCAGFIDEETTGIAVPLRGPGGAVVAALSVIVPNDRDARMQIPALRAAARGVSRAMGNSSH
jgi:DNA-binding IclR family transcriptional regulator